MKKLLSLVLAMVMLMACAAPALADEGSEPDWTEYDALVAEIKSTTDFVEREALLHKAEDMWKPTPPPTSPAPGAPKRASCPTAPSL